MNEADVKNIWNSLPRATIMTNTSVLHSFNETFKKNNWGLENTVWNKLKSSILKISVFTQGKLKKNLQSKFLC